MPLGIPFTLCVQPGYRGQGYSGVISNLVLVKKLQRRPRHIPGDAPLSVCGFEVCRLHERVDVGNLKYTFLLGYAYAVAPLRDRPFVFGDHSVLLSPALSYDAAIGDADMPIFLRLYSCKSQKYHFDLTCSSKPPGESRSVPVVPRK
jgi:hypothetical protein